MDTHDIAGNAWYEQKKNTWNWSRKKAHAPKAWKYATKRNLKTDLIVISHFPTLSAIFDKWPPLSQFARFFSCFSFSYHAAFFLTQSFFSLVRFKHINYLRYIIDAIWYVYHPPQLFFAFWALNTIKTGWAIIQPYLFLCVSQQHHAHQH